MAYESKDECLTTLRKRIDSLLQDIKEEKDFVCFGATDTSDYIMAQCHIDGMYQEIDYIQEHINQIESGERKVYTEADDYIEP